MSLTHTASIIVDNITSNEALNYPLVFLKGKVHCENCKIIFNGSIRVWNNNENNEDILFEVCEGKFKVIKELKIGLNSITLSFNCDPIHSAETVLHLNRKDCIYKNILKLLYVVPKGDSGNFQTAENVSDNSSFAACQKINLVIPSLSTYYSLIDFAPYFKYRV